MDTSPKDSWNLFTCLTSRGREIPDLLSLPPLLAVTTHPARSCLYKMPIV